LALPLALLIRVNALGENALTANPERIMSIAQLYVSDGKGAFRRRVGGQIRNAVVRRGCVVHDRAVPLLDHDTHRVRADIDAAEQVDLHSGSCRLLLLLVGLGGVQQTRVVD